MQFGASRYVISSEVHLVKIVQGPEKYNGGGRVQVFVEIIYWDIKFLKFTPISTPWGFVSSKFLGGSVHPNFWVGYKISQVYTHFYSGGVCFIEICFVLSFNKPYQ
eukprot:TRINITY_DN7964_c0_g2_i1.p2 TRINITY_DN7964_c0_g2~~TRINITY_DN7964_c0_g2_i1.p2  ORF type:complete len:106 (+),score=6.97 TRINITY_DN7964_c0_g2_i1:322-639(+)